ncbi:hypothetical protein AB0N67_24785 [Streptomyces microflavus]|uniref:hypothetical protein n=1 Tax=Streptomyces microflavus TaxID=1919 RepID=UPI003427CC16
MLDKIRAARAARLHHDRGMNAAREITSTGSHLGRPEQTKAVIALAFAKYRLDLTEEEAGKFLDAAFARYGLLSQLSGKEDDN